LRQTPSRTANHSERGSRLVSGRATILSIIPATEQRGRFNQFFLQVLHLAGALGRGLPGFVALPLGASQLRLQRRDGGADGLQLFLPLLRGHLVGLHLRGQLGDQGLLTLLGLRLGSLVLLLHFLAQAAFQLTQSMLTGIG
jgi:hypothetical protein